MNINDSEHCFASDRDFAGNEIILDVVNQPPAINKVVLIKIEEISIGSRLRGVSETKLDELIESIAAVGLLQPIVITEEKHLVAGLHRLKACERLGFTEIHAVEIPNRELRKEIAEIDENLIRNALTVLEQCEQLKRRKELYEALYPETRRGGYERTEQTEELQPESINDNHVVKETFSNRAAHERKVTPRTIQRAVRIAERLDPEAKSRVSDLPIALKFTQLMRLAELEPSAQRTIAAAMNDEKLSFSQALNAFGKGETVNGQNGVVESNVKTRRTIKKWTSSFLSLLNQFDHFTLAELQLVIEQMKHTPIDSSALHRLFEVCNKKSGAASESFDRLPNVGLSSMNSSANDESQRNFTPTTVSLPLFADANPADELK